LQSSTALLLAWLTVSWISFSQSAVRKDHAQDIDDLGEGCSRRRGLHNRVEEREIVDRSQVAGGSHRHARRHQLVGIGFALVAHDILLAGDDECRSQSPELFKRGPHRLAREPVSHSSTLPIRRRLQGRIGHRVQQYLALDVWASPFPLRREGQGIREDMLDLFVAQNQPGGTFRI
jgi:hypothetical protein